MKKISSNIKTLQTNRTFRLIFLTNFDLNIYIGNLVTEELMKTTYVELQVDEKRKMKKQDHIALFT